MDVNKIDAETVKSEIQELKNKKVELENKIITIQQIAARFSIAYGESEEEVDRLLKDIAEINRQIECLTKNI
jgi:peptidoglycan hydrolase CwlO-like protein